MYKIPKFLGNNPFSRFVKGIRYGLNGIGLYE